MGCTGFEPVTEQGFQAVNSNVVAVNSNLESVQSNLARGIRITASSTNELIKAESFGVKTAVNSVKTELSNQLESFQADFAAADARNQEWQFNNRAATVATLTVAGVTAAAGLLDRTYKNTEAINDGVGGIRNNILEGFEDMKDKFKKIGSMIDIGRIIDTITLITVIHNAAMLSSSLLSTLFQVIDNGLNIALNAMGIKDIDGQQVDSEKSFMGTFDAVAKRIFGVSTWETLKARWAATNRILSTGSTLLWSVRDLMDNTQTLAKIAAENSAKVGNALRRAGAIFDVGAWFPENYSHASGNR